MGYTPNLTTILISLVSLDPPVVTSFNTFLSFHLILMVVAGSMNMYTELEGCLESLRPILKQ